MFAHAACIDGQADVKLNILSPTSSGRRPPSPDDYPPPD